MHYILNRRADTHPDFCEDAYYYTERDGWVIAAVFDGCSDGIQSHFASQLYSYIVRDAVTLFWNGWLQAMNRLDMSPEQVLRFIGIRLWKQLKFYRRELAMEHLEMLSTVVLCMYHPRREYLTTIFMGDGAVSVNGVIQRVDSGPTNAPLYISYLSEIHTVEDALANVYPKFTYTNVKEFSVMTDGIDRIKHDHRSLEECISYLLDNKTLLSSEAMLKRKINIMHKEGMRLEDDLTIIRYVNETV